MNFAEKMVLIGGTEYAGEIKKSIFTVMNHVLPGKGIFPMHCSANYGADRDDVALFFGLSGTGKTTLSADPRRTLIGDDEHAWSDDGVFNIEGGCYAKVIRLSREGEPDIWEASHRFGTILENVEFDPETRQLDLESTRFTENTRSSYPITHLRNCDPAGSRRPSEGRRLPDLRRLRRAAAARPAHRGAGDVPLPLRLHRQGRGHRARHHRAHRDLLDLLRQPLPAAPPRRLRGVARREARASTRPASGCSTPAGRADRTASARG